MDRQARVAGGFSLDWLRLREPLDAASRPTALGATLAGLLAAGPPRAAGQEVDARQQVIDLGAGTGANLRYLAPVLGGTQDWLLVEQDPLLIAAQRDCMRAWADSSGAQIVAAERPLTGGGPWVIRGKPFECHVRSAELDLARQLDRLPLPRGALISASALLDLVSERWLQALAARAAGAAALVWFALTYDGRIECDPVEPEDQQVRELVNAHQLTDKGFGPALGPGAGRMTERIFAQHGYRTWSSPSDWRIGPDQRQLQYALIDGWFEAACEVAGRTPALHSWLERRYAHIEVGRSRLSVGHVDMVGCPG